MQQNGSTYFARRPQPPPTLREGSKGRISTFSEHGHVAYQINGNRKCSNMVANILPTNPPHDPVGGFKRSKFNFLQNMVILHIKFRGITKAAT